MAFEVFISYPHQNKTAADAACAMLEAEGISCWIAPRNIIHGAEWSEAIVDAIAEAKVMVLVFSAHANESPQIKREVERAVHSRIPIIPFRIEDVAMSRTFQFFLSTSDWLEAFTPPLEKHLQQLVVSVKALLLLKKAGTVPGGAPPLSDREIQTTTSSRLVAPKDTGAAATPNRFRLSRRALLVGGGTGAAVVVATAATLVGLRRLGDRPKHFSGHTASLTSVAFAPDGKTGVSGSEDKTAKVWNLETGEAIRSFTLSDKVSAVAFSSGGRNVLTGTENSIIGLWDAITGRLLHPLLGHTGVITSMAVLPDGRTMLSGSSNAANAPAEIITWNLESGNRIRSFPVEGGIGDIAVSPDGRNALFPYNVGAGAPISSLKIGLLDIESGKLVRTFEKADGVAGFAFSPDGRTAISWGDSIRLWDIATGNSIRTYFSRDHSGNVAFLPDGRRAVSARVAVEIWDIASGSVIRRLDEHATPAPGTSYGTIPLAVSPDGRSVLTADADNTLRLWDISIP
jgi:hypothetical protein